MQALRARANRWTTTAVVVATIVVIATVAMLIGQGAPAPSGASPSSTLTAGSTLTPGLSPSPAPTVGASTNASPSSTPEPSPSPPPSPTPGPTRIAAPTPARTPAPTAAPTPPPTAAPTPTPAPTGFDPARVAVSLTTVATIGGRPLAVVNAGDGSGRLFVADQTGRIWIVRNGAVVADPFLDIATLVSCCGERGLLGLAFHPNYPADPRVFVDYTDTSGGTVVSSFLVPAGTPDRADPASEVVILTIVQPYPNHNGGALAFSSGGLLHISTGDGGSGGDPEGYGQRLDTLLGKILRIDIDRTSGAGNYAIPAGNPFAGQSGARAEIWLTGLRNPWRISFDRATDDLWIGDVGQDAWEEIDVNRANSGGGANYGWNRLEGDHCFPSGSSCNKTGFTPPIAEYDHAGNRCTIIGGVVYRGSASPLLRGGYLFADYCSGELWAIVAAGGGTQAPVSVGSTAFGLAGFGEAENGEAYAVNVENGRLYRVVGSAR